MDIIISLSKIISRGPAYRVRETTIGLQIRYSPYRGNREALIRYEINPPTLTGNSLLLIHKVAVVSVKPLLKQSQLSTFYLLIFCEIDHV